MFEVIHLKPYTKEEFVEIAVNVLNKEEDIENDVAEFIAESVFNNLSANIRECVRIARLTDNLINYNSTNFYPIIYNGS